MANSYADRTWTLDTAGVITTEQVRIKKMEWHPAAVDNDLVVLDNNSKSIFTVRAIYAAANHESAGIESRDFEGLQSHGLNLQTIDGGTLYVYLM
jgi:hypothetical protein